MNDEVLVSHDDGLVTVTINRPERHNAVNRAVSCAFARRATGCTAPPEWTHE
ncbi:hypothetical protein ACT80S_12485 [Ramlibacter sp. MAHUQ-53]|uniref:hypothetical protein n=1 Tax=unclassified Ramlibacter TaxID=2617605 RepID=UPI003629E185